MFMDYVWNVVWKYDGCEFRQSNNRQYVSLGGK